MKGIVLWRDAASPRGEQFVFRGLGIRERMRPCIVNRPAGWDGYLLMFFHQPVTLGTDSGEIVCPRDQLVVWPPSVPHFYGDAAGAWSHSWCFCSGTVVDAAFAELAGSQDMISCKGDPGVIEWYLQAVFDELAARSAPDWRILANFVRNLYHEVERMQRGRAFGRQVPLPFVQLRAYIDQHLPERHTVAGMAARVNLSPPHFMRLFRRYYGVAPIEYVLRGRMRLASRLLSDQNLSITEIARRVGYDDVYQFSRMFRRRFGRSATEVRESQTREAEP